MTKMISYQYKFNTYLIIAQLPWGSGEALFKFSRCHLTFIVGKKKSYPGILQDISNDPIEGLGSLDEKCSRTTSLPR